MRMENRELFLTDRVPRYLKVKMSDGELDAGDIKEESLYLEESICSEKTLRFGCCEASIFKLRILDTVIPMTNKKIKPYILQEENEFQIGEYKVHSDKPTADRRYRDIIAFDAMYDIINADVSDWYNTILPNTDSTVTLKKLRDSFLSYFGIEQEEVTLINDDMIVKKTIEPSQLSGHTVITAICEINGCFGHIGRNGHFKYIYLKEMVEGLYPSDTLYPRDDLYPADPMNAEQISKNHYIRAEYEDFTTVLINKLQIRKEENDIGCIYGTGDNCYIIQDNFLVYGKSSDELYTIAENIYSVICKIWYRPSHVEAKGNPCLEVGEGIKLNTDYDIIYTYILQRTLKGIQALRDTYDAEGEPYQSEDVNSVRDSIIQLKGKTNKLTRTVDETILEMEDIEKNLSAQIALNAQQIMLKVSKDGVISSINQTAEKIKIQAQKIDLVGLVNADELVSKFATITTLNATKAELNNLIATKATIESLNAVSAVVNSINANYASIGELDVQKLRIDDIEGNYISASSVSATYATIYSVNSVNAKIDRLLNDRMQVIGYFGLAGEFTYKNVGVTWGTVNGYKVLMADE